MTRQGEGQDFASAAMMRLVAAGLTRQGIPVPPQPLAEARVPHARKRDLLDAILAVQGPLAILKIADAARFMPPEPVAQALIRARDISDLLERWRRLERFSHGRHTVETRRLADGRFRLTHRARDAGPPPSQAESLLVLGVLTILAEMTGSVEVSLATGTGDVWRQNGLWRAPATPLGISDMILSVSPAPNATISNDARSDEDPVAGLRQRIVADPLRRWTVGELAAEAGASQRTLQRRLTQRSVSFSRLVSEARLQVAASHLCDAGGPGLAEIAFLSGFSDQAHFARSFNRAVGVTPSVYRAEFSQ